MRQNPSFALTDPAAIRQVIRDNPWATFVSQTSEGLVASHYPVMVDESRAELSLLSHLGRPDDIVHEFGDKELLIVVQGPHGYISPNSYPPDAPAVPTWNFVAVHLSGVPEILEPEENLRVLEALVDHFESALPHPRRLFETPENRAYAERLQTGTVGLRLTPTRIVAKAKLSQNRPPATVDTIIRDLEGDGPYAQPELAALMRRTHERLRAAPGAASPHA